MVHLAAGLHDPGDGGDEPPHAHLRRVVGRQDPEVGREPRLDPVRAVPIQRREVVPNGMDTMIASDDLDGSPHLVETEIMKVVFVAEVEAEPRVVEVGPRRACLDRLRDPEPFGPWRRLREHDALREVVERYEPGEAAVMTEGQLDVLDDGPRRARQSSHEPLGPFRLVLPQPTGELAVELGRGLLQVLEPDPGRLRRDGSHRLQLDVRLHGEARDEVRLT